MDNKSIYIYANCLVHKGRYEQLNALLADKKSGDKLFYFQGLAHAKKGNYQEAVKVLLPVVQNNPKHAESRRLTFNLLLNLATVAIVEDRLEDYTSYILEVINVSPNDLESNKLLQNFKSTQAVSYIMGNERKKAAEVWIEQFEKTPKDYSAIHNLTLLFYWWAINEEQKFRTLLNKSIKDKTVINFQSISSQTESTDRYSMDKIWRNVIKYWILLINSAEFWEWWKNEKQKKWDIIIKQEDIDKLKNSLIDDKLSSLFINYTDYYLRHDYDNNSKRIKKYQAQLKQEAKSSEFWSKALDIMEKTMNINFAGNTGLMDVIPKLQEVNGEKVCFGSKGSCTDANNCLWSNECSTAKDKILSIHHKAGCLYYSDKGFCSIMYKICKTLSSIYPKNEELNFLRIYLLSEQLGFIHTMIKERIDISVAVSELTKLPEKIQNSVEANYVSAWASMENGNHNADDGDFDSAFVEWQACVKSIETIYSDKTFDSAFSSLKKKLENNVERYIEGKCTPLLKVGKYDVIIKLIDKTLPIASTKRIKEIAATVYKEKGYLLNKLKRFRKARDYFQKALNCQPNNVDAKKGMSLAYNNEGVGMNNMEQKISYFASAVTFDKSNPTIVKNFISTVEIRANEINLAYLPLVSVINKIADDIKKGLGAFLPLHIHPDLNNVNNTTQLITFHTKWINSYDFSDNSRELLNSLEKIYSKKDKLI